MSSVRHDQDGGGGALTKTRTRRVILFVLLAFAIYTVVNNPQQAADYVKSAMVFFADAVRSVFSFFDALLRRR
jgi:hypothetical protein